MGLTPKEANGERPEVGLGRSGLAEPVLGADGLAEPIELMVAAGLA